MNLKIPKTSESLQKIAKKIYKKSNPKTSSYATGAEEEKVWDNFQLTKGLKRKYKQLCNSQGINSSAYFRACVLILLKHDGDVNKLGETFNSLYINELQDSKK